MHTDHFNWFDINANSVYICASKCDFHVISLYSLLVSIASINGLNTAYRYALVVDLPCLVVACPPSAGIIKWEPGLSENGEK